jgi:hypothetical protein
MLMNGRRVDTSKHVTVLFEPGHKAFYVFTSQFTPEEHLCIHFEAGKWFHENSPRIMGYAVVERSVIYDEDGKQWWKVTFHDEDQMVHFRLKFG